MDQYVDPLDKVLSFIWLYNWEDPLVNIGYPMLFDAMSMAGHDTDYRALFHEWFDGWIELLGERRGGGGRFRRVSRYGHPGHRAGDFVNLSGRGDAVVPG